MLRIRHSDILSHNCTQHKHYIGITWVLWRLKWPEAVQFIQRLVQANNKDNITPHINWTFVRGIHHRPVDFPHKGPVMWKPFSCDYVISYQMGPTRDHFGYGLRNERPPPYLDLPLYFWWGNNPISKKVAPKMELYNIFLWVLGMGIRNHQEIHNRCTYRCRV